MRVNAAPVNPAEWNKVVVKSTLPTELERLKEIAYNIWWTWNYEALNLFRDMDPEAWNACHKNPVALLETLPYKQLETLVADKVFMERVAAVYATFRAYLDQPVDAKKPSGA